jgi:hypothetical protein
MARLPLRARIYLEQIGYAAAPAYATDFDLYLWTVFFKLDGDTVTLGDDLQLQGTCTVMGTPGSHGNLGPTAFGPGGAVHVPRWASGLRR